MNLPHSHEQYTDSYFLRSKEILLKENLDPFVRMQVFIRIGLGKIYGLHEALEIVNTYSDVFKHGGRAFGLTDGEMYSPEETILTLEGRISDLITLETMILGVISAETTKQNDKHEPDINEIKRRAASIFALVGKRPVHYFGARHWSWNMDGAIARATKVGGFSGASTEIGANNFNNKPVGTIPHSLQTIFDWRFGKDRAVVESLRSFDKHIDSSVPRIALVDYRNKEVDDTRSLCKTLGSTVTGIRIDTAGENVMQGGVSQDGRPYWGGNGVTISGVLSVRKKLKSIGFKNVGITLSSGFGNIEKVKAFVGAESLLGVRLFDALGVGELFSARSATMDVVGVGETIESIRPISKVGRMYRPNPRLHQIV